MADPFAAVSVLSGPIAAGKPIKLVVWDLDDTVWQGTLLEGGVTELAEGVAQAIRDLDARGILHSIASRNDAVSALEALKNFGLADYFLVPQIGWGPKSHAVRRIADRLNLGLDSILFIDDQAFEREEVTETLPQVRALAAEFVGDLVGNPLLIPPAVTVEARRRRLAYLEDAERDEFEQDFVGPNDAFLEALSLKLFLRSAGPDDLIRADELILRTSQLNSTGVVYTLDELEQLRLSPDYHVLVARLSDRFGDYGTIGLMVLASSPDAWRLKLLVVSCRVLSRGVGAVLLNYLMSKAYASGAHFKADFVPTGRNRPMQIAYRFAGLQETDRDGAARIYSCDVSGPPPLPAYYQLVEEHETAESTKFLNASLLSRRP